MQAAEPRELGLLEPRDHAEDADLLAMFQLGLEAHHVPQRAEGIVLPELHHGVQARARMMGVGEADRLHRAVGEGLAAALGHDLDRQAALEIGRRRLPLLERGLLAGNQRVDEGVILRLVERAVDVVGVAAAGPDLVVARLQPAHAHVDAVMMHDRGDGIEEGELGFAGERLDRLRPAPAR